MFKHEQLTDFEKLQFSLSYIKELKKQLRLQESTAINAVKNLSDFKEDIRSMSKQTSKLVSYKEEMMGAHVRNKKLNIRCQRLQDQVSELQEKDRLN